MYWWILDLIIVVLLAVGFFVYFRKGLLAAVVGIVGTLLAVLVAFWASDKLTPYVYDTFVKDKVVGYVQEKLVDGGSEKLSQIFGTEIDLSAVFGDSDTPAEAGEAPAGAEAPAAESAAGAIADSTLGATVRGVVRTLLAIIIFFLALLIIRLIVSLLQRANKIPLLGAANKLLGGALGLAMGALWSYIFVSACALAISVSLDSLSWLNTDMVDRTLLFSLIYPHNLLKLLAGI